MARGGARPGAGRPKGTKGPKIDVSGEAAASELTPLDYMLSVVRDVNADVARRDRMAQAAAPYVHARMEGAAPSRKEQAAEAAKEAAAPGAQFAPPAPPKLVVNNRA